MTMKKTIKKDNVNEKDNGKNIDKDKNNEKDNGKDIDKNIEKDTKTNKEYFDVVEYVYIFCLVLFSAIHHIQ